ncbi:MAG: hypothetical protein Q7J98_04160, partial [Kiritimatiellia bacterium]|nr:hypothetical protein [Kiritimatiellia bacterium]
ASDALYNFDCKNRMFRATVARASRYADDNKKSSTAKPWQPAVDRGELTFCFLLTSALDSLPRLAADLECPPEVLLVPPSPGPLPRRGSLLEISPPGMNLLALKPAEDRRGIIFRLQESAGKSVRPKLTLLGHSIVLGMLGANRIGSWRLQKKGKDWKIAPCDTTECGRSAGNIKE